MFLYGLDKNRLLVVGVSGGADSLALLGMLHEAGFPLLVCHFNHRLRPEAESDAAFVQSMAETMGLPFEGGSEDVGSFALANRLSVEEAARKLRYHFLFGQARTHMAQGVAVGHTADDQVETVLMNFLRGAGLGGLKGMLPPTVLPEFDPEIPLIRPLLDLGRARGRDRRARVMATATKERGALTHPDVHRLSDVNRDVLKIVSVKPG